MQSRRGGTSCGEVRVSVWQREEWGLAWSVDCCPSPMDWDGWPEHWRMSRGLGKGNQQDPRGPELELACCCRAKLPAPALPGWLLGS